MNEHVELERPIIVHFLSDMIENGFARRQRNRQTFKMPIYRLKGSKETNIASKKKSAVGTLGC